MALSSVGPGNKWRQQHESLKGSNTIGSSSTERWNDVPHGTMDEVSSHVRLDLPFTARPPQRLFHLVLGSPMMEGPGADSEEKREPVSDINTVGEWIARKRLTLNGRLEKRTSRLRIRREALPGSGALI